VPEILVVHGDFVLAGETLAIDSVDGAERRIRATEDGVISVTRGPRQIMIEVWPEPNRVVPQYIIPLEPFDPAKHWPKF
jgi:hypothetical protein